MFSLDKQGRPTVADAFVVPRRGVPFRAESRTQQHLPQGIGFACMKDVGFREMWGVASQLQRSMVAR